MNEEERITLIKNGFKKIDNIIKELDGEFHPCEICEAKLCSHCYICNENKFKVKKGVKIPIIFHNLKEMNKPNDTFCI
jgi:hypothetical protein